MYTRPSSASLVNGFPATTPSFDERQFESETFSSSSEEFLKLPSPSISTARTEMMAANHTDADGSLTLMFSGSLWMALTRDTMLINGTDISVNATDINETVVNKDPANNNNNNNDDDEFDEFYTDLLTVIMYSLIIVVSLCGNSLVLRMILAKKKLQTTTNILIAWLAVSDLLTTTLNIPFNVARFLAMNYPFPALFCKLVPFIQVMCVYVSTLIMGVIAVHRYMTVTSATMAHRTSINTSGGGGGGSQTVYGQYHGGVCAGGGGGGGGASSGVMNMLFRTFMIKGSMCLCAIVTVVWLLAGALATPHSMFNQIVYVPYKNKTYVRCRAEYPKVDFNVRFVLSLEAFFTQYLIPLGLICVLYIKIGSVVAKQGRIAQKANSRRRMEQDSARRRRLTMLILVVLVFGICWLPLNLYHLLVDFRLIKSNFTIFLVCHWIAMSSVCWNPFIYCWLNESFRKGATKMIIFICFCCCPQMKQKFLQGKTVNNNNNNNNGSGGGSSSLQTPATATSSSSGNEPKSNSIKESSKKVMSSNVAATTNDVGGDRQPNSQCSTKRPQRQQQQQQQQQKSSSTSLTPPTNRHHRKNTPTTPTTTNSNDNNNNNNANMRIHFLPRSSSSSMCSSSSAVSIASSILTNPEPMVVNSSTTSRDVSQSEQAYNQNVSMGDGHGQKVSMEEKKGRPRKFHKLRSFSLKRKHNNNANGNSNDNQTMPTTTVTTTAKGGAKDAKNLKKNPTKTARNASKKAYNNSAKQKNDKNFIIIIDQQSNETVANDDQCELDLCPKTQTVVGVSKDETNITTNTMTTAVKSTFV